MCLFVLSLINANHFQVEVYGAIEAVGGGQNILFCPLRILSFVGDNRLGWGCGAAHNMI